MEELNFIITYIIGINIIAFSLMGIDKQKAKKRAYRIPERTLWGLAILGGAAGSLLGMRAFRHKTKHRLFIYGMPSLIIIHLTMVLYIVFQMS